jgi:multidrug resistance efflux pump
MNFLSFLNPIKFYILGGILAIFVSLIVWKQYQVNSLRAKLAESIAQATILSASIETSNKAIEKLSEDSLKRIQSSQDALNKANLANGISQNKITSLKAQLGKVKSCDAAVLEAKGIL